MSHALVTIVSRIPDARVADARQRVEKLGNPASPEVRGAFEALARERAGLGVHFASLTVLPASGGGGHLVFEFSADGEQKAVIAALARHLGPLVSGAFDLATDRGSVSLDAYWLSHVVRVGQGFFDNPGVVFAGTPGLTVRRILDERDLRVKLRELLEHATATHPSALAAVEAIRAQLRGTSFAWALEPEDALALHPERSILEAVRRIAPTVARMYLWPLAILPLAVLLLSLVLDFTLAGVRQAVMSGLMAALVSVALAVAAGLWAYLVFRRRENRELPADLPPDPRAVALMMERENHGVQNHLAAVSVIKAGMLRRLALRLVFGAIVQVATHLYRPGWLGTLGTIHFARWVTVPGTPDLLFLSNYGGSWESYLEDFITKAHNGLTGVWSNTEGFPRSANLIQLGASDGDRFKRWARRQMTPTGCWYSAYPDLTTTNIRTNAAIRQGLGTIVTEEEARRWLSFFGSTPRPASSLEVNEIQSLVFGGLGFLRFGGCLGFALNDSGEDARAWLGEVRDHVAFGDGRRHIDCAIILALGAGALRKLGLPDEALATFPPAFLQGMSAPSRARLLGDHDRNAPAEWHWGGPQNAVDGVLLLYAASASLLDDLHEQMVKCLATRGHAATIFVPFVELPDKALRRTSPEKFRLGKLEPFGFVDGISQPIVRGTYKALRGADPIHIVEAGEFILGYPDNRGYLPAGPTLAAIHDPLNRLPISAAPQHGFARPIVNDDRDLGRNGTFLAIRQLEQDTKAFWHYCDEAAEQIQQRFPRWTNVTREFVGAKLVGRWPDGSSMVRFPYEAGSEQDEEHLMMRTSAGSAPLADRPALPPPPVAQAAAAAQTGPRDPVPVKQTPKPVRAVAITPDNDFLFGSEDPQGLRCPFGSHIRRANPRESADAGSLEQLAITNRHRILRVGRRYQEEEGARPGLFFMCLNADLERQFEFVQQTWLQAPTFHGLMAERDPLLGSRAGCPVSADGYTIPTRDGPVRLKELPEFVRTLGGGYFFVPGKALLCYLASPAS